MPAKTDNPAQTSAGSATPEVKEDPAIRPSVRIADTEMVRGVLTAIECGDGMVLVVRSGGKLLRFAVTDPVKLQFFSKDPNVSVNIGCGPIHVPAFVFFKPLADRPGFAGDAVAVEFTKH